MTIPMRVVRYAAQECSWQQSGELSVSAMIEAWLYAERHHRDVEHDRIWLADVYALGRLVEPRVNQNGLRTVNVQVGYSVKMQWGMVPLALDDLLNQDQHEADPAEWFRQYEEIHPFRDGNGRTGSLLFNWLRGTLHAPIHPPNLWHDPRRDSPSYPDPDKLAWEAGPTRPGLD